MLSLAVTPDGERCFSGSADATIQRWNVPGSDVDPYDTYGTSCGMRLPARKRRSADVPSGARRRALASEDVEL